MQSMTINLWLWTCNGENNSRIYIDQNRWVFYRSFEEFSISIRSLMMFTNMSNTVLKTYIILTNGLSSISKGKKIVKDAKDKLSK